MIKTIPFDPAHAYLVKLNRGYEGIPDLASNWANIDGRYVETYINENGEVLAIFSAFQVIPGVIEIAALIGVDAAKTPIAFIRHCKARLNNIETIYNAVRIQATIRSGYEFLTKYVELFGFQCEGLMRRYGRNGYDCYLYARVKT